MCGSLLAELACMQYRPQRCVSPCNTPYSALRQLSLRAAWHVLPLEPAATGRPRVCSGAGCVFRLHAYAWRASAALWRWLSPRGATLQACVWTGDCSTEGCANKCIINDDLAKSYFVLHDRAIGEGFYTGCPLLAHAVNLVLGHSGARRRLLTDGHVRSFTAPHAAPMHVPYQC